MDFCPCVGGEEVSWTGGLVVATWHTWACQWMVPTCRGARELEARQSRMRCQQGRRKQRRCVRHFHRVLGTDIVVVLQ
jgi:hypothetical protein